MVNEKLNEQELLFKFSMFEKQINELQQQIESVQRGILDLNSLDYGLDELVGSTGKEIFAPLGKGIFVNAKLMSEELNVDIGNGNFIKKNIPETKELLGEQIIKLKQVKEELENNLEGLGKEITKMMGDVKQYDSCKCKEGEECDCGDDCDCKN